MYDYIIYISNCKSFSKRTCVAFNYIQLKRYEFAQAIKCKQKR